MSTAMKFRRGTTAEHAAFTGVLAELTVDTTKKTAVVHDGVTAGGTPLAKESALASYLPIAGGTMTGAINEAAGDNIASAGTVNLTTATGNFVHITGTTTITAITLAQGSVRTVVFDGALTLTHGASLLLPTAASVSVVANDVAIFRGEAAGVVRCVSYTRYDGTQLAAVSSVGTPPAVRQTVLNGPVDTNGASAFGGSTGSTTVTASGTLTATAASGSSNRTGSIVNPSWTGLSTNGTMYLYLQIDASGVCTTGSVTLAPTYRNGGADVVTNNQHTFNTQEMQMKVGNGSVASQTWRVFVGEVAVATGVVSAITWYALMGRYVGPWTSTLPGSATAVSVNHNIGVNMLLSDLEIECVTTDAAYAVGDQVRRVMAAFSAGVAYATIVQTYKTCGFTTNSGAGAALYHKTTGNSTALTAANWKYRMFAERTW